MGLDNPLHIAFLLIVLLLVFGAKRLPEIGRSIGTGMREFKDSISGMGHDSTPMLPQSTVQQPPAPVQPAPPQAAQPQPAQPQAAAVQAPPAQPAPAQAPPPQPAPGEPVQGAPATGAQAPVEPVQPT